MCLRCSGVYAGVMVGLGLALARASRSGPPGRFELALWGACILAQAAIGFGDLYGLLASDAALKLGVALAFGTSIAQLAGTAIAIECGYMRGAVPRALAPSLAAVAVLAVCAVFAGHGGEWPLRLVGTCATVGVIAAPLAINAAVALCATSGVARGRCVVAFALLVALCTAEGLAIVAWRRHAWGA